MNWISDFVKPRIKALVRTAPDVPDRSWVKCPLTGDMVFHRELENNLWVFPSGFHGRMPVSHRFSLLFDGGEYELLPFASVKSDPLNFRDLKRYRDRLKEHRARAAEKQHKRVDKEGESDALQVALGDIGGLKTVVCVFDFDFMGGSMGVSVGESFLAAAESAISHNAALVVVTASGGARMQEGALSLMQLPRTTIGVRMVKEAGLPYIVILADPTTGGVSASFAMLGDVHIAEAGATIGFAGKRVIRQTVGEELPDGFQTSEYLFARGMIDIVVERSGLKSILVSVLSYLHPAARRRDYVRPVEGGSESGSSRGVSHVANDDDMDSVSDLPKAAE